MGKKNEPIKQREKKQDAELEERIVAYKDKVDDCIRYKKVYELEQVLVELGQSQDKNPENLKMYHRLRLNIIQGQIFLGKYFEWKEQCKQNQVSAATKLFKDALEADKRKVQLQKALAGVKEAVSPTRIIGRTFKGQPIIVEVEAKKMKEAMNS